VLAGCRGVEWDAELWLRHACTPSPTGYAPPSPDWSVFDPDGGWLGEVWMPEPFCPADIETGEVPGVLTGGLGVEYIV
jgi:hypothetical protein